MTEPQRVEPRPQDVLLLLAAMSAVIAALALGLAAWGGGLSPLWLGISFGSFATLFWAQYRKISGTGSVRLSLSALALGVVALLVLTLGQQWWSAVCVGLTVAFSAVNLRRPSGPSEGSTPV